MPLLEPSAPPALRRGPRRARLSALALVAGVLALAAPHGARAQVTTVDEGSFTIVRGGATVGREEFRILRQPAGGGSEYMARALAAYGDRRIAPALQTDAAGLPLRYQVEVRNGRVVEQRLTGQLTRAHFATQTQTGSSEAARTYLVGDTTVVVDDELFHQYFFLALHRKPGGEARVPVLVPRRNVHGRMRVQEAGADRLTLGARTLDATRLEVTEPGGRARTVWVDAAGRVLRVASPSEGLVAQRDDPPR
ncbi:hypothetical protein [Roseisolibacter agri]|uniref:Uncharacterized protein n=1 Tax=Roseisolibacter agri TaxID=2014610 RepID=A0AA37VBC6_9BACT|nr:hypothetical protein [Roseisolibacter agri]GLC26293.1 hypothetical protein rosag_28060 [Roseisolibacter agri]